MKIYHPCYDKLIEHLLTFLPGIDPRFPDLLIPTLSEPLTAKEDIQVLKNGQIADLAFWPVEGFIRTYEVYKPEEDSEEERQHTISISSPDKISLDSDSFMNRNKATACMEIAKGSTVVTFGHSAFLALGQQIPQVATLALNIISDAEKDWKNRIKICQVKGVRGYTRFLKTFTDVEAYVFQKDIASCIGMTAQNLSTIRTKGGFSNENLRR